MATYFGEVLDEFSRAVEEEDDNDEQNIVAPSSILRWSQEARQEIDKDGVLQCSSLIIAIGQSATSFVDTYILRSHPSQMIGLICSGVSDDQVFTMSEENAVTDKSCYIHRLNEHKHVIIVQCRVDVLPEQAYSWTQQLIGDKLKLVPSLQCPNSYVAILCSQTSSSFNSEQSRDSLQIPFIRSLKSSHFAGTPLAPTLEQPNYISGLPAQLLSYCEIHKLPAVLYSCYTDVPYLDITSVKAFNILLRATPFRDIIKMDPESDKYLSKIVHQHTDHNTLYV